MAWIIFGIIFSVLTVVQTLRLIDRDGTIRNLRIGTDNLDRQSNRYYNEKHDALAKMHSFRRLYEDACEEITALNQQVSRLEDDVQKGNALALKLNREIIDLKQQNRKLISRQKPNSIAYLKSGMCDIARFIAANQWMMEESKSLAEAVASVSEVAEAITEREN